MQRNNHWKFEFICFQTSSREIDFKIDLIISISSSTLLLSVWLSIHHFIKNAQRLAQTRELKNRSSSQFEWNSRRPTALCGMIKGLLPGPFLYLLEWKRKGPVKQRTLESPPNHLSKKKNGQRISRRNIRQTTMSLKFLWTRCCCQAECKCIDLHTRKKEPWHPTNYKMQKRVLCTSIFLNPVSCTASPPPPTHPTKWRQLRNRKRVVANSSYVIYCT